MTAITTLARKLQRDLTDRTPDSIIYYDADGQYIDSHLSDVTPASGIPEHTYAFRSGRHTQREVQNVLDAYEHGPAEWPEMNRDDAVANYLDRIEAGL